FEPKIPGRFRWNGPEELIFSPSQPLLPATNYKAKINDEVLRFSNFNELKQDKGISFHTAPLVLNDVYVSWVLRDETTRMGIPQVNLHFNYPVVAEDVKNKITLQVDGKEMDFEAQHTGATQDLLLLIPSLKAEDKTYEAKLTLKKGLKPAKGSMATEEDITTTVSISSPYVLNVNSIEAEHDGTMGIVHIYTSQQLNQENMARFINFEPAINYTTEFRDNGITLRSDKFDVDKTYELNLLKGLRGRVGGVMKENFSQNIAFGQLESEIKFTNSKAVYLSKKGGGNVEVRITNTPKVRLIISRIYENNLLMAERNGYYPAGSYGDGEDEGYYRGDEGDRNYAEPTAGDVIYSKDIDTRSLPKSGGGRLLNISQFEDRLPDVKGVYHVMIRSVESYWVSDSRFISFSDIGLISKHGKDKMLVFANSIKSAQPLKGITINVYGANNQLLGTAPTNADGAAEVVLVSRSYAGYKPAMVVAKSADDFTYLPLNNTKVNTSRFDVGGKRDNASNMDAFIYAERDIYRPGEKLNYAVLLRDNNWQSPGAIPLKLKFLLPNGKELKTFRKSLNEQGALEGDLELSPSAITGSYLLEVYAANDVLLASKSFMIEEFVPDRIRVNVHLDKNVLTPSQTAQLRISASNFFGPPAANRNYETEIQVRQKRFTAQQFPGFDFTLANQQEFYDKELKEGKTDEEGNASLSFEADAMYSNRGLLQVGFFTTVFDETGRPVSRHTSAEIFTQEIFHGIKTDGSYYYPLNQPVNFLLLSLNRNHQPVNTNAQVQVVKREYKTVLTKSGSYFRYESQQEDKIVYDQQISIGNSTKFNFVPRSPGDYEVRIYRPGASTYVSKKFYSYGSWGGDNSSFEVNTEGHIDIEADKPSYRPGDMAKLLFKTPFSGRLLITMETDQVLSYQYLDVDKRTASMELKISESHLPNVYISATLIKPHELSDIPLTVAHGFQNLKVEGKDRQLPVVIQSEKNVRSKTRQKVRVKTQPGSYVTLAAVDNGILQVTDFKTPDPYNYYYQKKALQVNAFDMYPLLFPEIRNRASSTGGDGDLQMNKRVNPMPAKRFKLMSYWSGMKKADGNGHVDFEYDVPQFSGEIRLMAVAYKDNKFGSADATTTVADPIVLSTALPRFISPGDTVTIPVTITNTTNKTASAKTTINVSGPVKLSGGNSKSLQLNAKAEGRAVFQLVADPRISTAQIKVQVQALGETFTEDIEISVRPPSTLQKLSGSGSIAGGTNQQIQLPQRDFIPGSYTYELVVSKSPIGELGPHLRYLVQYPFGCTEQVISSSFPQLYFSEFTNLFGGEDRKLMANNNVIEAIRKIKMRQLYNGAVTLWDGEGREDWWTTVYATHFLLEARKAGFDVDESLTETMLAYLANRLRTKETITYYYNRNQNKKIAPKEVAYSLYVLSIAGRAQVSSMNYYKSNTQLLALDSRYLLSAAFAVSGDKKSFNALLPTSFSGEESVQQTGGSFYSALRDEAIALNALLDTDPGNAQIPVMAKHVSDRLKRERYMNTQERAFAFLSLGKLARSASKSNVSGTIQAGGKTIKMDGDWKGSHETLGNGPVEIKTTGQGRLYYSWVAEGISSTGAYVEEDNFIKVRRQFFDRYGRQISGNQFTQNELIIVEVTLQKLYDQQIENIVITDLLPAGFEIENPRTKELPGMEWIKNASEPVALDVRDDRIHFFVNATAPTQKYYYAVRAVSPGSFKQGPVSADAMYNGEMHSYHGARTIKVIQR
ncbi:MAG: alpha-2-macroglobulin family protein, partial [Flavisolibacter sp.]|nr:alpha-2-macroglobulin family protein [Flavisolibacter sp.]